MNLQEIENRLRTLNPAAFQELGDLFLISKDRSYAAFIPTGSQFGKQKTTKGTPDTFIYTQDGEFYMVEYSTNETLREKKLIEDIDKCIKEQDINISKIKSIALFTNFPLTKNEAHVIQKYAEDNHVQYTLYDGSRLSRELLVHHKDLIYHQLGIHVDTGQIVSIDTFIHEYDNTAGSIAAPLSNKFQYREKELLDIKTGLLENDLVLLHGAPGVGKTKLAIQAIREFCNENLSYKFFCISYKGGDLLTDLTCNVNLEYDNIIFVDDINRVGSFGTIMGFYSSQRKGKLKIVMTVRDYAYEHAKNICYPHPYTDIFVCRMKSEQIAEIVKTSFNIQNKEYLDRICHIAKGNPRIAMMAGKIALQKQCLSSLNDVSTLFDTYYGKIINDIHFKNKKTLIKCAGIIAFFSPLKYEENDSFPHIISCFGVSHADFTECIDVLNTCEIVDLPQGIYAKVSEQNLSMYLFYLSFIKEKVLSIEVLFKNFFSTNKQRFRDCIIPVNNAYGADTIEKAISPGVLIYYNSLTDHVTKYDLLYNFWPYLLEETLTYISEEVYSLPLSQCDKYSFDYKENDFAINEEKRDLLNLTSQLFILIGHELKSAIELAFDYVRRKPEYSPNLMHAINEAFMYRHYDNHNCYYRQSELVRYVLDQINNDDPLCKQALWHISKLLFVFNTNYSGPSVDKNTYSLYQYRVQASKSIFQIRKDLWLTINNCYSFSDFRWLLNSYTSSWEKDSEYPQFDMPYILKIIKKHMDKASFENCISVQKYLRWAKRHGLSEDEYGYYYRTYQCNEYRFFVWLSWNRLRDKELYDYNDYDTYHKYKLDELKKHFVFQTKQSYDRFLKKYVVLFNNSNTDNRDSLKTSLDFIVKMAFDNSVDLGCHFLRRIVKYDIPDFLPNALFFNHLNSENKAWRILNAIQSANFTQKPEWIVKYFEHVSIHCIIKKHLILLLDAIKKCKDGTTIVLANLKKLKEVKVTVVDDILTTILKMNREGKRILLNIHDLDDLYDLKNSADLVQQVYLQQIKLNIYFDFELKGLFKIMKNNPHFLLDYVRTAVNNNNPDTKLSQIWGVHGIDKVMGDVLQYLRKDNSYMIYQEDKWDNAFFMNIKDVADIEKAKRFLENQFKKGIADEKHVEQIVLISRGIFQDLYQKFINDYIDYIPNHEAFFRIDWLNLRSGIHVYGEGTTFGDIEAAKWNGLLRCLEGINNPKIYAIRAYIKRKIFSCQNEAEEERRRNYLWR